MNDANRGETVQCGECKAPMVQRTSRFGPFWGCSRYPECQGTHGAHPDGKPLGVPADRLTRVARIAAHGAFDKTWKGRRERGAAYKALAEYLGIPISECHIGAFDVATCARVIVYSDSAVPESEGGS